MTRNYTWLFNDEYSKESHPLQNGTLRLAKFDPTTEAINTIDRAGALSIHTMQNNIFVLKQYAKQKFRELLEFDLKPTSIDEFKKDLALFFYIHAHMMEASRGSAAIAEWKQKIITGYKGYEETYCSENWKDPGQHALACRFDDFLPQFMNELVLTKKEDN